MVARTPAAAIGLVYVLRTKELTGSYAAAGAASGVSALAGAVFAPTPAARIQGGPHASSAGRGENMAA